MSTTRLACASALLATALAAAAPAQAETVYGLTAGATTTLVSFDSANPASLSVIAPVSGIINGLSLKAIDFRPADGLLYGLATSGSQGQLYVIDTHNGVASSVGRGFSFAADAGLSVSIDFNPVVDRVRIVGDNGLNLRLNPNTGAIAGLDTALSVPGMGDVAYANNHVGATQTTLYGFNGSQLVTIGGLNGSPSPNTGLVNIVGPTGASAWDNLNVGFDIGSSGSAYLSFDDAASSSFDSEFYRINLSTGATQFVGKLPVAMLDIAVAAAVPEPETAALWMAGLAVMGRLAWRRRQARG